jgi:hypothetical protein
MLSFGTVAFIIENNKPKVLSDFYRNLELLDGATPDPDTMNFWSKNQEAYDLTRQNLHQPQKAMKDFVDWINRISNTHKGKPVFIGYPATFDFMFIHWYIKRFGFENPFSFSALDIKTYAMAVMKSEFRQSTKKNMPKRWFPKLPHTHHALDDALEQGHLFCNILIENLENQK